MKKNNFEAISVDELWVLRQAVVTALTAKILTQKRMLERRLKQLTSQVDQVNKTPKRRYPAAVPKYRNPSNPSETWAGKGKRPRWLVTELKSGKRLDDFRV
jgi:DNA-binding protein H-NS